MILLDGKEVEWTKYPNGEVGLHDLKLTTEQAMQIQAPGVTFSWENDKDLMKLYFLKRLLEDYYRQPGLLVITYMPYSRMDRTPNGEAFTLKYVAQFINSMNWDRVVVVEPHSDVTMALLDRSAPYYPIVELFPQIANEIEFNKDLDVLVFPDAGAEKRYAQMFPGYNTIVMSKTRDFQTGKITGLKADTSTLIHPTTKALIIDDLCSRGGTFVAATKELVGLGVDKVYLYVTHCEPTIFKGLLLDDDGPDHIFTTDAMPTARMTEGWPITKEPKITVYHI